jgi:hypothetical protein
VYSKLSKAVKEDLNQVKSGLDQLQESQQSRSCLGSACSCKWSRKIDGCSDIDRQIRKQENQDVLDWLSPLNFWPRQSDLLDRRKEGTGGWLFRASKFEDWLSGEEKTLWCPGIGTLTSSDGFLY